jgi:hypothetical protein
MPLKADERRHLVAALLTVNGYPVERAVALMPAFQQAGLLDLRQTADLDGGALSAKMAAAGYARGGFLPILGYRLVKLLEAADGVQLDELPRAVARGDAESFKVTLSEVHGFGPNTAAAAWLLWTS